MDDIRWIQRFANYRKSLDNLEEALQSRSYNKLELQGLIKGFELCYELAWKTLQDLLRERGYEEIAGPKPVIRQAFKDGLLRDGEVWNAIHEARNLASHINDLDLARQMEPKIRGGFADAFRALRARLEEILPK
jgi:nucleotidyltransferase substrate binding protein (TIGR01987 family)